MAGLASKLTIVTGGASGIGKAISDKLLKCGGSVATIGLTPKEIEPVEGKYKYYICNVGVKSEVERFYKEVKKDFGRIPTGLVNNAGIVKDNWLLDMTEEQWDDVLQVNLKSVFLMSQFFVREIVASSSKLPENAGSIVNVASILGKVGNRYQSNYSASKGGVIAFTKSIAKELAEYNIRANSLLPGFIDTPMTKPFPDKYRAGLLTMIPSGRFGTPEEMAEVVAFLLSDDASYVSGSAMEATGATYT